MSRPLRLHYPGMLYHLTARGNNKQPIYADDRDREFFLAVLAGALARFDARCAAYCLMWNHYHLLLKSGAHPLWRLMQQLNSQYCQRFNRRHQRVGHVLQGRYGARLIEDGAYARAVLRYVALNPVTAEYCADPAGWRWSSYWYATGCDEDPPEFLALDEIWRAFETDDPEEGRMRLKRFVTAGTVDGFPNPLLHGGERLREQIAPRLVPYQATGAYVYAQRFAARASLDAIFAGCTTQAQVDAAAHEAFYEHAYTLEAIGHVVARDPSVASRWIQRERRRRSSVGCGAARETGAAPADAPPA